MVIKGINALIPGERYDLDPVDIGASGMRQSVDEEKLPLKLRKLLNLKSLLIDKKI